ncbi:MAG: hypothetical protein ACJ74O_06765 [Frankiaceae bacterium]
MDSFEDRVAANRAARAAADEAAAAARTAFDRQATAAAERALEKIGAVEAAVKAVRQLPLPAPYRQAASARRWRGSNPVMSIDRHQVYAAEEFKKALIGDRGTVTVIGWRFSIYHHSRARLEVDIRPGQPATFDVSTPGPRTSTSTAGRELRDVCKLGIVSWDADKRWESPSVSWPGSVSVVDLLDSFLTVAVELVVSRTGS